MKIFQPKNDIRPLGPLLRKARLARNLSPEEVALAIRLSPLDIESIEEDHPQDARRARIQAVSYLRFLGMNPTEYKEMLPPLPSLSLTLGKNHCTSTASPLAGQLHALVSILAPMGKLALSLVLIVTLLGGWGIMRQLSRVRNMPWISASYSAPEFPVR